MSDHEPENQRFTDQQVGAILRRAVEMQSAGGSGPLSGEAVGGTSLAQLQQAAAELGIDARLIADAAAEVAKGRAGGRGFSLLGGPWSVDIERAVAGPVTEEAWPLLVQTIRRASGRVGATAQIGNA